MRHRELRNMRHYHLLNSTCDIGDPPSRAPILWSKSPIAYKSLFVSAARLAQEGVAHLS